jgi:hypothetical protein
MPSLTEWDKFRLSMRTLKSLSSIIKDLFTSQDTLHILETVDVVKNIITEDMYNCCANVLSGLILKA